MRVVVTGATGNVGTSVVKALDAIVGVARRRPQWRPPKTTWYTPTPRTTTSTRTSAAPTPSVSAAWNLHLLPASPTLLDLALSLPVMDTTRARTELGWEPSHTSLDAIDEFLHGLRRSRGMNTPPLESGAGGPFRVNELTTGVGERATP
jgi:nucleoside-diphosphate-sugar epimerase